MCRSTQSRRLYLSKKRWIPNRSYGGFFIDKDKNPALAFPAQQVKCPKEWSNPEREVERVPEPSTLLGLLALSAICGCSVVKGKKKI